ncbi:AzlC family ABC transporter permease [Haloplanus salilacus]|uniref:AzlC family ABC transporter permease n=1 Tax=Haloplanus salilacus TaxID=2949994 RepID=UPI0030D5B490
MSRLHAPLLAGARASLPLLLGLVPFGLVAGVAAVDAGLSPFQAVGLSVVVFAGASQLAVVDLLGRDASLAVVVLTATIINLRMSMYSASIAPHFADFRRRWRILCAYLLTDMSYALAIAEFTDGGERSGDGDTSDTDSDDPTVDSADPTHRRGYYLGAAVAMWLVWQAATVVGVVVGARIPDRWGVGFAVPLVFLALLVPDLTDRPRVLAALVGGSVAVAGAGWPLNLGLVGGALAGVVAGVVADGRVNA